MLHGTLVTCTLCSITAVSMFTVNKFCGVSIAGAISSNVLVLSCEWHTGWREGVTIVQRYSAEGS